MTDTLKLVKVAAKFRRKPYKTWEWHNLDIPLEHIADRAVCGLDLAKREIAALAGRWEFDPDSVVCWFDSTYPRDSKPLYGSRQYNGRRSPIPAVLELRDLAYRNGWLVLLPEEESPRHWVYMPPNGIVHQRIEVLYDAIGRVDTIYLDPRYVAGIGGEHHVQVIDSMAVGKKEKVKNYLVKHGKVMSTK